MRSLLHSPCKYAIIKEVFRFIISRTPLLSITNTSCIKEHFTRVFGGRRECKLTEKGSFYVSTAPPIKKTPLVGVFFIAKNMSRLKSPQAARKADWREARAACPERSEEVQISPEKKTRLANLRRRHSSEKSKRISTSMLPLDLGSIQQSTTILQSI